MILSELSGFIWLDGEMVDWKEAKVHLLTHTLHYGLGVFEGVRAYETPKGTAIFRLEDHTDRLFKSAEAVNLDIPFSAEEINRVQCEVVKINNLSESYIRPMCFFGSEGMGLRADNLKVHVMVAAWEWPSYMSPEAQEKGIKVKLSPFRRQVRNRIASAKVNGNYVTSIVALNEAISQGYDEALMLDYEGYVAEGSGENIFIVSDGRLQTPDLDACLDGITRRTIIDLAKELGIETEERKLILEDIFTAEEVFFTGTAAEVVPINSLDDRTISNGKRGPLTEKLQNAYFEQVKGTRGTNFHWHTVVKD